jgi:uncharacterized ubiquitin-like protein YukD
MELLAFYSIKSLVNLVWETKKFYFNIRIQGEVEIHTRNDCFKGKAL